MKTILIVEDDYYTRDMVKLLIAEQGYETREAANGQEALEVMLGLRPDLIITDIVMPVMDGYELVQHLRSRPETARIPVILYSGVYDEREVKALGDSRSNLRYLSKPASPE